MHYHVDDDYYSTLKLVKINSEENNNFARNMRFST